MRRLTKEIINQRLLDDNRGISFVGNYTNARTKSLFECLKKHQWLAKPYSVHKLKSGCPHCDNQFPLTKEEVNKRITSRSIIMIGEYISSGKLTQFKHIPCGTKWASTTNNILNGNGCPNCTEHGFRNNELAYGYLIKFNTHIKYGITNHLTQRLNQHKLNGQYTIVKTMSFSLGKDARAWEKKIKQQMGGGYIDKSKMPYSGHTETLHVDKIPELLKFFE